MRRLAMGALANVYFLLITIAGIHEGLCTIEGVYDFCDTNEVKEITLTSGTLSEPQNESLYDGNMGCRWSIQDQSSKDVLFFNVSYIQLASSGTNVDCNTERFIISDGFHDLNDVRADLCGTINTPTYVYGVTNAARIFFLSEASGPNNHGFTFSWFYAPICSVVREINLDNSFLQSFTWPWYNGTPDCVYIITVSINYIRISINSFTKTGSSCDEDYLEISNANDPTEIWHKFCASISSTKSYYGAGNSARITHHRTSDSGSFALNWEVSETKGQTLAERQAGIIGGAITGGIVLILLTALTVALKCHKSSPCYYKKPKATTLTPIDQTSHSRVARSDNQQKTQETESNLPHIMISYQWDVKPQVLQFRKQLGEAGYRVWIDVEQMHKKSSTFDAMTEGIEDAAIVVPILTSKYQESVNCRKEIEYADKCKTPIVPVRLEQKFKPTKWLSFLLGNSLWHDLSNPDTYDVQFTNFLEAVSQIAEAARRKPENSDVEAESEDHSAHQVC